MRLSIIAFVSLFICAVFASPVISGRSFENGVSFSRRTSTPSKKVPVPPSNNRRPVRLSGNPSRKAGASKTVPQKTRKKGSTPAKTICKHKRDEGPVAKAVKAALLDRVGNLIGEGLRGKVYRIPGGFGGRAEAVVKEISVTKRGANGIMGRVVKNEVRNLVAVDQLLAWGVIHEGDEVRYYLIMPKMGVRAEQTGLDSKTLPQLREKAVAEYRQKYHIENGDAHDQNFTYMQKNGEWKAEIIDWGEAKYFDGRSAPSDSELPEPETVQPC